ncbi:6562_t:CDS:2 [Funneliformis caledonium]|uniref:6562_t:CDS:1 n=1 Tax=Funneliformis caledonium TaxID=1117310 RepID=A0A9N9DGC0_9GLOM|nr:6562_t:CDS:2 [Funneliformis caledonium]
MELPKSFVKEKPTSEVFVQNVFKTIPEEQTAISETSRWRTTMGSCECKKCK